MKCTWDIDFYPFRYCRGQCSDKKCNWSIDSDPFRYRRGQYTDKKCNFFRQTPEPMDRSAKRGIE